MVRYCTYYSPNSIHTKPLEAYIQHVRSTGVWLTAEEMEVSAALFIIWFKHTELLSLMAKEELVVLLLLHSACHMIHAALYDVVQFQHTKLTQSHTMNTKIYPAIFFQSRGKVNIRIVTAHDAMMTAN